MNSKVYVVLLVCLFLKAHAYDICERNIITSTGSRGIKVVSDLSGKLLEKEFVRKVVSCEISKVKEYLDKGVDINARVNFTFSKGVRAINQAVEHCDVAFVSWLIREGANINVLEVEKKEDEFSQKPALVTAITAKNKEVIKFLIEHKDIDINSETLFRNTALSVAIDNGDKDSVRLLLAHPNIDIDKNPLSMLPHRENLAQAVHHPDIFSLLLNHEVSVKPFSRKTLRSAKKFLEVQIFRSQREGNNDHAKKLKILLDELTAYKEKYIK